MVNYKNKQSGAVSIFSVIFATLLLSVLTVSFMRLMVLDSQRATNNDLSQSALDSALAGVEDAKRVIRAANKGSLGAKEALKDPSRCDSIAVSGINGSTDGTETLVRSNTSGDGEEFNQAYTCVKISMDTEDFLYEAQEGQTQVIPLNTAGTGFDRITIEWYTQEDVGDGKLPSMDGSSGGPVGKILPKKDEWGSNRPPMIRAQVITPGKEIDINQLDDSEASKTVFLYPSVMNSGSVAGENIVSIGSKSRRVSTEPDSLMCSKGFVKGYSCKVSLDLGKHITAAESKNAMLRLNTIYKGANVKVSLSSASTPVKFNGIQPTVDSTGRASNLFRRVEARLQVGRDFPYPENVVELDNSLCKDFYITDGAIEGSCKPYQGAQN